MTHASAGEWCTLVAGLIRQCASTRATALSSDRVNGLCRSKECRGPTPNSSNRWVGVRRWARAYLNTSLTHPTIRGQKRVSSRGSGGRTSHSSKRPRCPATGFGEDPLGLVHTSPTWASPHIAHRMAHPQSRLGCVGWRLGSRVISSATRRVVSPQPAHKECMLVG